MCGNSLQHCIEKELKDGKWLAKHTKFSQKMADECMKNLLEKNGFSQNLIMAVKAHILNKLWRVRYTFKNSLRPVRLCPNKHNIRYPCM